MKNSKKFIKMSLVYLPQRPMMKDSTGAWIPKWDLSSAGEYGTIVPVLSSQAKPFNSAPIIAEIKAALENYSDDDYIIAIGNPALLSWCVAIAAWYNGGFTRMLQWSSIDKKYLVIEANLGI